MPVDQPWNVYREQLSSLYHGYALWEPDPVKGLYEKVSVGDVGYVNNGFFYRLFNVTLPWDDPSNNKLGELEYYKPLDLGRFLTTHEARFDKGDYHTPNVAGQENVGNTLARTPRDAEGITYQCQGPGALLSLPHSGHREDVIRPKVFQEYIRDHVVSWFDWSQKNGLGVERMEDLILVTGCTLVTSWAAVAFLGRTGTAEISLVQTSDRSETSFEFNNIRGNVAQHCSSFDSKRGSSQTPSQCVFVRGFRAKRFFFWTRPIRAEAEPLPDDPDSRHGDVVQANRVPDAPRNRTLKLNGVSDYFRAIRRFFRVKPVRTAGEPLPDNSDNHREEIQVTQVPDAPKYRDPLIGVLDYIAEKCPEGTIAIAHDDDLQLIKDVETLTADAVEQYLRENQIPVLIKNGAAILLNLRVKAPSVSDNRKSISIEAVELGNEQALAISSSEPNNATHAFTDRSSIPSRDDVSVSLRPRQAPVLFAANSPLRPENRDIAPAPDLSQPTAFAPSSSHKIGMPLSSPSQYIGGMTVPSPAQPNIKPYNFRPLNYSREWHAPSLRGISTFPANTSISAQTLYEPELLTPPSLSMAWPTTVTEPPSDASFEKKLRYVPFGSRFRGNAAQRALKARREQVAKEKRKAQDEGAVQWLINNMNGNNEMDTVLTILGSFNRRWGREIWESVSTQGNSQPDAREAYSSSSAEVHIHTPSDPPRPPKGTPIYDLCKNMQYLFSTYNYEADFTNTEARRRRMYICIQTTAALVCCTDFHLGWFGEIGEVLSEVGHNERIDKLSTFRLNPSFTLHWTCLSLVAIRQMMMVEGNRVRALAGFAVSGIARFQLDYGAPDTAAFNGAQKIDEYMKTAWEHIEDLHRAFEPGDLDRSGEEIREILRDRGFPIWELEGIEVEASGMEDVDWRISLLRDAVNEATHKLTQRLPGVSFIEFEPSGRPIPIREAFDFPFFGDIPVTPQFTFLGQQLRSLFTLGRGLHDIVEERNPEKHVETIEGLASIDKFPISLRRLNGVMIRQLWRFQDLRDGGGFGFTTELFFLALRQLSSTSPMPELKRVLYIGTFKAITSGWENITDLSGTQRILLNLICDIVIKGRGVFSDFPYPDYIVDMLLELVGKMVNSHGNAHPQIHDAVDELWGVSSRNMDRGIRDKALLALGPYPLPMERTTYPFA